MVCSTNNSLEFYFVDCVLGLKKRGFEVEKFPSNQALQRGLIVYNFIQRQVC